MLLWRMRRRQQRTQGRMRRRRFQGTALQKAGVDAPKGGRAWMRRRRGRAGKGGRAWMRRRRFRGKLSWINSAHKEGCDGDGGRVGCDIARVPGALMAGFGQMRYSACSAKKRVYRDIARIWPACLDGGIRADGERFPVAGAGRGRGGGWRLWERGPWGRDVGRGGGHGRVPAACAGPRRRRSRTPGRAAAIHPRGNRPISVQVTGTPSCGPV